MSDRSEAAASASPMDETLTEEDDGSTLGSVGLCFLERFGGGGDGEGARCKKEGSGLGHSWSRESGERGHAVDTFLLTAEQKFFLLRDLHIPYRDCQLFLLQVCSARS